MSKLIHCLISQHGSGVEGVLRKRLKSRLRKDLIQSDLTAPSDLVAQVTLNPYGLDYLCVLDFEATCQERNPSDFIYEIIEFPVLLLNLRTLHVVSNRCIAPSQSN